MTDAITPPAWVEAALCTQIGDPEIWFPEKGGSPDAARRTCWACPVRQPCLDAAIARDEGYGVWGGLSTRERHAYANGTYQPRTCTDCGDVLTGSGARCRDCQRESDLHRWRDGRARRRAREAAA